MNILVINAGSSSIKYQLMNMDDESVIAKGLAERIGIQGSNLEHKPTGRDPVHMEQPMNDHVEAMNVILQALTDSKHGVVASMSEVHAVGHRVVHGGESFSGSMLIDDTVIAAIEENAKLAPLHNPPNLMGIEACRRVMPQTPMVAVFDTAFHQSMPPYAYLYALPYEYYERLKVRRYGFHGTSHMYVAHQAAAYLNRPVEQLKIITCHLGNGSSITAVDGGKSVDTSMGLTPLEGVPMGTRSGDIDPAILEFIMQQDHLSIAEVMTVLNKKSGLLGISGVSSDMRDNTAASKEGNVRAEMALQVFAYRIKKYVGAYAAAMGGLDCVVFTAGIGENVAHIRASVLNGLDFLGIRLDAQRNEQRGNGAYPISTDDSPVKALVVPTNEELVIARDTLALVNDGSK